MSKDIFTINFDGQPLGYAETEELAEEIADYFRRVEEETADERLPHHMTKWGLLHYTTSCVPMYESIDDAREFAEWIRKTNAEAAAKFSDEEMRELRERFERANGGDAK